MEKKYQRGVVHLLLVIVIVIALGVIGYVFLNNSGKNLPEQFKEQPPPSANTNRLPSGFSLPFNIEDIDKENGIVNPLGVIRSSKDAPAGPYPGGHPGIDFPLTEGTEISAVADGEVVNIVSANDPWGGMGIIQLLESTSDGEGWAYLYEHITPKVKIGDMIKRGQVIATKTAPSGFTAHFQYSFYFNDFKYSQDNQCWVDSLNENGRSTLASWWNEYSKSTHFTDSWQTIEEEGKLSFQGLLDESKYPNGPQLCYPIGTDVR